MDCTGDHKFFCTGGALDQGGQFILGRCVYFLPQVVDGPCLADQVRQGKLAFLADELLVCLFILIGLDNLLVLAVKAAGKAFNYGQRNVRVIFYQAV